MGNCQTPVDSNQTQSPASERMQDILNQFDVSPNSIQHPQFGKVTLITNKRNLNYQLALQYQEIHEISEIKSKQQIYHDRSVNYINQNIINLQAFEISEYETFFSNGIRASTLYDNIYGTLADELKQRKSDFTEHELWILADGLINGISFFQSKQIAVNNLSFFSIYMCISIENIRLYKIADDFVIQGTPLWKNFKKLQPTLPHTYLSPEALLLIIKPDISINFYKSTVFTLGMILLHLSLAYCLDTFYDYVNQSINFESLSKVFNQLEQKYSKQWSQLIKMMLMQQPEHRVDCIELNKYFEKQNGLKGDRINKLPLYDFIYNISYIQNHAVQTKKVIQEYIKLDEVPVNRKEIDEKNNPNAQYLQLKAMVDDLHNQIQVSKQIDFTPPKQQQQQNLENSKFTQLSSSKYKNTEQVTYGKYEGDYLNKKKQGKGTLYYQSGKIAYQGMFKQDKFDDYGKLYNENPIAGYLDYRDLSDIGDLWSVYEGDFKDNKKQGYGVLTFSTDEKYSGGFINDLPDGQGSFITKDKTIFGRWDKGKLFNQI